MLIPGWSPIVPTRTWAARTPAATCSTSATGRTSMVSTVGPGRGPALHTRLRSAGPGLRTGVCRRAAWLSHPCSGTLGARGPLGCPARERRGLSRSGLGYSGHRGAGGQVTGAGPCHQMGRGSAGQGRPRARCSRHGLVVVTTKLCITRVSSLVL